MMPQQKRQNQHQRLQGRISSSASSPPMTPAVFPDARKIGSGSLDGAEGCIIGCDEAVVPPVVPAVAGVRSRISSVYMDDPVTMEAFQRRQQREDGASLLRIRWYGGGRRRLPAASHHHWLHDRLMEEDGYSHDDDGKGSAEGLGIASAQPLPVFLERKVRGSR